MKYFGVGAEAYSRPDPASALISSNFSLTILGQGRGSSSLVVVVGLWAGCFHEGENILDWADFWELGQKTENCPIASLYSQAHRHRHMANGFTEIQNQLSKTFFNFLPFLLFVLLAQF